MLSLRKILFLLTIPMVAQAESHYWGGQRSLTEIRETTAATEGVFGYATGFWSSYLSFMNANGCSTATWRPCSMSDIREAFTNRVTGWNTIGSSGEACAWINAYDVSGVIDYDSSAPTSTNCTEWNNTVGYGTAFCFPEGSGAGEFGFALQDCGKMSTLLCCR